jgi:hypothetical protein
MTEMNFVDTAAQPKWPMFQVMDVNGRKIPESPEITIDKDTIFRMYRVMVRLQALDDVFYNAQVSYMISLPINQC